MLDPAITKVSWIFYHFFHPEPIIFNIDPLLDAPLTVNRQAFDANQALPELIFGEYLKKFSEIFPMLSIKHKEYLSLWVYPLSGGFRKWSLIPKFLVNFLLNIENYLSKYIGQYIGFRILVVSQKGLMHAQ